jgi:ParB family chromosome partitioning protein
MTDTATTLELVDVDPRKLQINPANVRKKTKGIDELAESIAKVGVLVPLIVRSNGSTDSFVIVAGERRALAAVKANTPTVPVIVRSYGDNGEAELTAMMIENLHREDLSPADEARGFEQLAAFGLDVGDIAALTGRKPERVTSGLAVAKSSVVADVADKHDLTLEQLAAIAEVEDNPDDVKELIDTAQDEPEYFDHALAQVRETRKQRAERQAHIDKLTGAGVKIITKSPSYGYSASAPTRLDLLVSDADKKITAAGHKKCPGHAAYVPERGYGDRKPVYVCTDPKKNGHKSRTPSSTSTQPKKTAADREQAAKDKAELEELTKQLEIATGVRRKFVKTLLSRKSAPKGTLAFVVPVLVDDQVYLDDWDPAVTEELTGVRNPSSPFAALASSAASDAQLQVVLLARVVCSIESNIAIHHLHPKPYENFGDDARYLRFLESLGYALVDVERKLVDANTKA